ncbi:hypothetical protein [Bacillus infantis]|uniref:hypothetical protein n=1 Tax=Bacillus infantis TaxID=324767 RepID=UPI003CFAAB44
MMFFKILLILFSLSVSFYKIFLAFTADQGTAAFAIRLTAGIIMAILAWLVFKERHITRKQRLHIWQKKEASRGMALYVFKWAIGWGILVGFIVFSSMAEFKENEDLFGEYLIYMSANILAGVIAGWLTWRNNQSETRNVSIMNEDCS